MWAACHTAGLHPIYPARHKRRTQQLKQADYRRGYLGRWGTAQGEAGNITMGEVKGMSEAITAKRPLGLVNDIKPR